MSETRETDPCRNKTRCELARLPEAERAQWKFWCDVRIGLSWTMRYHFTSAPDRDAFEAAMREDRRAIPVQVTGAGEVAA